MSHKKILTELTLLMMLLADGKQQQKGNLRLSQYDQLIRELGPQVDQICYTLDKIPFAGQSYDLEPQGDSPVLLEVTLDNFQYLKDVGLLPPQINRYLQTIINEKTGNPPKSPEELEFDPFLLDEVTVKCSMNFPSHSMDLDVFWADTPLAHISEKNVDFENQNLDDPAAFFRALAEDFQRPRKQLGLNNTPEPTPASLDAPKPNHTR
jgi:hypothetical protein